MKKKLNLIIFDHWLPKVDKCAKHLSSRNITYHYVLVHDNKNDFEIPGFLVDTENDVQSKILNVLTKWLNPSVFLKLEVSQHSAMMAYDVNNHTKYDLVVGEKKNCDFMFQCFNFKYSLSKVIL